MTESEPPDPDHEPGPPALPPRVGRWMLATLGVTLAILAVQLYPYRFTAGAGPFLGMVHPGPWGVLGQVALFVPLGVVETQLVRRLFGYAGGLVALLITLDGAVLSLIGQSAQYWLPDRTSSLIDLVANTFGTVIGYKLTLLLTARRPPA